MAPFGRMMLAGMLGDLTTEHLLLVHRVFWRTLCYSHRILPKHCVTSHRVHASHTLHTGHYIDMRAIQKCVKGCDFGRLEGDFCPQPLPSSTPPVLNHSPPQPLPSLTPLVLSPSRPQPLPSSTPPCHNPSPSQPLPPPLARLGPKSGWSRLGPNRVILGKI